MRRVAAHVNVKLIVIGSMTAHHLIARVGGPVLRLVVNSQRVGAPALGANSVVVSLILVSESTEAEKQLRNDLIATVKVVDASEEVVLDPALERIVRKNAKTKEKISGKIDRMIDGKIEEKIGGKKSEARVNERADMTIKDRKRRRK